MDTGAFENMVQTHQQEMLEFYRREAGLDDGQPQTGHKTSPLRKAIRQVLKSGEHRVGQINLMDYESNTYK